MDAFSKTVRKIVGLRSGRLAKDWVCDARAALLAPPIVADINNDGKKEIIFGTKDGRLTVLSLDNKELWSYQIREELGLIDEMFLDHEIINSINATPAIADLTGDGYLNIVFGSEMGVLFCLDEKGREVWKFKITGGIRGSPLIADINDDGQLEIVFGATDNYLYLLDRSGKLIERFEQESPIESTPGFFNGQIVFGTNDGSLISITADGHINWVHKTKGQIIAQPAFGRITGTQIDFVIVGSADNNLYCLDVDGELVWTYETQGSIYSKVTLHDINDDGQIEVLVGSCDNSIHAVSSAGERIWTYETDFWIVGSPIVEDVDGDGIPEVVVGSYDHNIYILDKEGSYLLDYVPGLSAVVQQAGHYSDIMTQEPGDRVGKKLWQFKADGVIVSCQSLGRKLIVTTKAGIIDTIIHTN
jgi:outer membrane protein assembly factor BamB